jgi:hypothetical protein
MWCGRVLSFLSNKTEDYLFIENREFETTVGRCDFNQYPARLLEPRDGPDPSQAALTSQTSEVVCMESLYWAFWRRSHPPHRRTTSQPAVVLQDLR